MSKDDDLLDEQSTKVLPPSRVQQQFAREADINYIMAKYSQTGRLTDGRATTTPLYGDFSDVKDFHEAQSIVSDATAKFAALPARVRFRFSNDPEQLLAFLSDPSNHEEAVALGLVEKGGALRTPTYSESDSPPSESSNESD